MKSISHGIVSSRIRSAMKKTAPLSTPTRSTSRPSYSREISAPSSAIRACSTSSSIRTSPTRIPQRDQLHVDGSFPAGRLRNTGHGDDVVSVHDERPGVAFRARHLGVHEQILHFLAPACEPVARPPAAHLEAGPVRLERPRTPAQRSLEPQHVVLANGADAAAEVGRLRSLPAREQPCERPLERARQTRPLVCEREERRAGARIEALEQRQDLGADQPALRAGLDESSR